uniref:HEAT repeat-containing protein 1 n=1 Tax=Globodera pallida TaxID=36090 RepID=A0A183BHI4_GLOPA
MASTSLQQQLKRLKSAPTGALAVERDYSSLLYTKKEASALDHDEFYKIGLAGLSGMKKVDDEFDAYAPELFAKEKTRFNRAMLQKDDAEQFNRQIETFLLRLSPHFHHQCCRQVLEWLVHNYQIHTYNAEAVLLTFLPYHSVNSFGRLIHILKFNATTWDWLAEYQKDAAPIMINILCRACQVGRSYWLVSTLSTFVQTAIERLGPAYVNERMQNYFTFLVALFGNLIENSTSSGTVDDQLLSRLMPFLSVALKSKLEPFKCAGIMLWSCLSMNVTALDEETAQSALKLLLYKLRSNTFPLVLQATCVLCQRLSLDVLPKNATLRIVYNEKELNATIEMQKLMELFDMSPFLVPFWRILIEEYRNGENETWRDSYLTMLINTMDLERMNSVQAGKAFQLLLDWVGSMENGKMFPENMSRHIRSMVIRFVTSFDEVVKSAQGGQENNAQHLMDACGIQPHEVGQLELVSNAAALNAKGKRKKRVSGGEGCKFDTIIRWDPDIKQNGGKRK